MAIGDDAQAAGMELVPATSPDSTGAGKVWNGWREFNRTRDYIAQFFTSAKAYADGILVTAKAYTDAAVGAISLTWGSITDKPGTFPPSAHTHDDRYYDKPFMDGVIGALVPKSGAVITGDIFLPNSGPANFTYTNAFINGDGRVSRGASSERYKENIGPADLEALSGVFDVPLDEFEMIGGDGTRMLGRIAEKLAANPATARFVIWLPDPVTGEPRIESYDMLALLFAQAAVLDARLKVVEDRHAQ